MKEIFAEITDIIGKSLICFGAGKGFDKFFELFAWYHLENSVRFIVDNQKTGFKSVSGVNIPIVSPEFFLVNMTKEDIGLITLKEKTAIIRQYQNEKRAEDMPVCHYWEIMSVYCTKSFHNVRVPVDLRMTPDMRIPKVIHYCWFGRKEIPYENRVWMESWEKFCPDYKIIQWNEDNYELGDVPYAREAYEVERWGFMTDYVRLDIIYKHGGIYLDTDVELIRSLDELLYQHAFMGWEDGLRVASGLGMGAEKGFPLMKEMRDDYLGRHFIKEDGTHDLTACPAFQTDVLERHGLKRSGEYQVVDGMAILPVTYLCGIPSYVKGDTRTKYTFGLHHFQGSWRKGKEN